MKLKYPSDWDEPWRTLAFLLLVWAVLYGFLGVMAKVGPLVDPEAQLNWRTR